MGMDAAVPSQGRRMDLAWSVAAGLVVLLLSAAAVAQTTSAPLSDNLAKTLPDVASPATAGTVVRWLAIITVLAVAPAVAVMVTSFTRIIVVLSLLRQALATPQLPPNQVLFGLALLMTLVVMAPTYTAVHGQAVGPYLSGQLSATEAWQAGQKPLRAFLIHQIAAAGNEQDVYLFLDKARAGQRNLTWSDVPTLSLIPAFAVSELKVAFLIGFRVYLPFVVIDMLVAATLISMGMLMVPPVLVALPLKLLMFVLADGWHLVVGTLMTSFQ
jgi:flagellar biosynthetic protein FliP